MARFNPMAEIQLTDTAQYPPDKLVNLGHYAYLTPIQKLVLSIVVEGITSDLYYTDEQIAEKAQISRNSVVNCRHNVHYLDCLREATISNAQNKSPVILAALEKTAMKGSVRAQLGYLEITGIYTKKLQTESINKNLNINANIGTGDAIEEFVALLSDKGMSLERIVEAVTTAYHSLREQQRVM
jgi:DNA-binding CsgD family transcriptional regulator